MDLEGSLDASTGAGRVEFAFAVENVGSETAELTFPSARTHDVAVVDGGEKVWRWSHGRAFAQVLSQRTLDPGETATFEAAWDDPAPGEYEAVAELAANGVDCEARATFDV